MLNIKNISKLIIFAMLFSYLIVFLPVMAGDEEIENKIDIANTDIDIINFDIEKEKNEIQIESDALVFNHSDKPKIEVLPDSKDEIEKAKTDDTSESETETEKAKTDDTSESDTEIEKKKTNALLKLETNTEEKKEEYQVGLEEDDFGSKGEEECLTMQVDKDSKDIKTASSSVSSFDSFVDDKGSSTVQVDKDALVEQKKIKTKETEQKSSDSNETVLNAKTDDSAASQNNIYSERTSSNQIINNKIGATVQFTRLPVFVKPTVIALWQMSGSLKFDDYENLGKDDLAEAGAQLLPSGEYEINRTFATCALIGGELPQSISVLFKMNYPEDRVHDDDSQRGCGHEKFNLKATKLKVETADKILCKQLKDYNNNLVSWQKDPESSYIYDYSQMCGSEGALSLNKATLYCAEAELGYDDPAGNYKIEVIVNNNNRQIDLAYNFLNYLPLTLFETDFSDFDYGLVEDNKWKILPGDDIWGPNTAPTIRNIGNTRLQIVVRQNDFGIGKKRGQWNILYKVRLGHEAEFKEYFPEKKQVVNGFLGLGQSGLMDFGIFIKKFPNNIEKIHFRGDMLFSAQPIDKLSCKMSKKDFN